MSNVIDMKKASGQVVRVAFASGFGCFNSECSVCGEGYETGSVRIVASVGNVLKRMCHDCLRAGPEGVKERIARRIDRLEQYTESLKPLLSMTWKMPAYAEYQEEGRKHDEALQQEIENPAMFYFGDHPDPKAAWAEWCSKHGNDVPF